MNKIDIGNAGETIAQKHLIGLGYIIIETNWHCQYGEIDIIAKDSIGLVFVEVRTRQSKSTDTALASITTRKKQRFIKSIYSYLNTSNNGTTSWRADIIGIALRKNKDPLIDHVEDALDW